jgi:hypothetical protein
MQIHKNWIELNRTELPSGGPLFTAAEPFEQYYPWLEPSGVLLVHTAGVGSLETTGQETEDKQGSVGLSPQNKLTVRC